MVSVVDEQRDVEPTSSPVIIDAAVNQPELDEPGREKPPTALKDLFQEVTRRGRLLLRGAFFRDGFEERFVQPELGFAVDVVFRVLIFSTLVLVTSLEVTRFAVPFYRSLADIVFVGI